MKLIVLLYLILSYNTSYSVSYFKNIGKNNNTPDSEIIEELSYALDSGDVSHVGESVLEESISCISTPFFLFSNSALYVTTKNFSIHFRKYKTVMSKMF